MLYRTKQFGLEKHKMGVAPWFADKEERDRRSREQRQNERLLLACTISEIFSSEIEGDPLAWGDRIELTYRIKKKNAIVGEDPYFYVHGSSKPMTDTELKRHFREQALLHLRKRQSS
jgi:hypothetical protein